MKVSKVDTSMTHCLFCSENFLLYIISLFNPLLYLLSLNDISNAVYTSVSLYIYSLSFYREKICAFMYTCIIIKICISWNIQFNIKINKKSLKYQFKYHSPLSIVSQILFNCSSFLYPLYRHWIVRPYFIVITKQSNDFTLFFVSINYPELYLCIYISMNLVPTVSGIIQKRFSQNVPLFSDIDGMNTPSNHT